MKKKRNSTKNSSWKFVPKLHKLFNKDHYTWEYCLLNYCLLHICKSQSYILYILNIWFHCIAKQKETNTFCITDVVYKNIWFLKMIFLWIWFLNTQIYEGF